jgi:hypothetical protein
MAQIGWCFRRGILILKSKVLSMAGRSTKASQSESGPEPFVGIFWLLDDTLLTDSVPLNEAEPWADHLSHSEKDIQPPKVPSPLFQPVFGASKTYLEELSGPS